MFQWRTNCATTWRFPTPRSRGHPRHPYVLPLGTPNTSPNGLHTAITVHPQHYRSLPCIHALPMVTHIRMQSSTVYQVDSTVTKHGMSVQSPLTTTTYRCSHPYSLVPARAALLHILPRSTGTGTSGRGLFSWCILMWSRAS